MERAIPVSLLLLVLAGVVSAQTETLQRALPNWLTGIVAVVVFLFLVFVVFLVNKAWCSESREESKPGAGTSNEYGMPNGSTYETTIDVVRSEEHENVYINTACDGNEEKSTIM